LKTASTKKTYTEEGLVTALRAGDKAAFSYLYDHYSVALYGIVLRIVRDEEQAQDLLQEGFIKIWKNIHAYDNSKGRLFTWMLNICRNHTLDLLRSKGYKSSSKIQPIENSVHLVADSNERPGKHDFIGIDKVLDKLPPEQRILINKVYFEGFTHEETSKELEMPLGTVKTRIRSAIIQLRKLLS
jgi:RNA polymerase sigma factor (sigma-70 family)